MTMTMKKVSDGFYHVSNGWLASSQRKWENKMRTHNWKGYVTRWRAWNPNDPQQCVEALSKKTLLVRLARLISQIG